MHARTLHAALRQAALSQFAGGNQREGLGLADASVATEVRHIEPPQLLEASPAVAEDAPHEVNGILVDRARADEDGQQFSVGEMGSTMGKQAFARTLAGFHILDDAIFHNGFAIIWEYVRLLYIVGAHQYNIYTRCTPIDMCDWEIIYRNSS